MFHFFGQVVMRELPSDLAGIRVVGHPRKPLDIHLNDVLYTAPQPFCPLLRWSTVHLRGRMPKGK